MEGCLPDSRLCEPVLGLHILRPNMASQLMSIQARPLARAQLRHQARPVSRPACIARHQLARVGAPGLAALEREVHQARVGPSPRARRAVVTEAAKKSVGDLAKGDLEGKVVLVRAQPERPLGGCRRLRLLMPGLWPDMLFYDLLLAPAAQPGLLPGIGFQTLPDTFDQLCGLLMAS